MEEKKYAAFISYRHGGTDEECAKLLHQSLESYRFPPQLAEKLGKKKIGRIFRDVDELPTSDSLFDNIEVALGESDFLIVICSPRLKESRWCMREIEVFSEKFGQDKILAVLAEGEPEESFPEMLTHRMVEGELVDVEPLAADMRGENNSQRKKKLKTERLRMLASMTGCEYDQLFQRERRRRTKRITAVVAGVFAVIVCFTAVMVKENFKLQSQVELTQEAQSYLLTQYSETAYLEDNRITAALLALEGLPEKLGDSRPFVPESLSALTNALQIYDYQNGYTADSTISTNTMDSVSLSEDGKYAAYIDLSDWNTFDAHIYDIEKGKTVADFNGNSDTSGYMDTAAKTLFFGGHFCAITGEDALLVIDTDTMKQVWSGDVATELSINADGTVIAGYNSAEGMVKFYKTDGTVISQFTLEGEGRLTPDGLSDDGKLCAVVENFDDKNSPLYIIDTATGKIAAKGDKDKSHETGYMTCDWSGNTMMFKWNVKGDTAKSYGYYDGKTNKFTYGGKINGVNIARLDSENKVFYTIGETSVKKCDLESGDVLSEYSAGGEICDISVTDEKENKWEVALTDGTLEYIDFTSEPYCISSLKGSGEAFTRICNSGNMLAGYLMNSYEIKLYRFNEKKTEKTSVLPKRSDEVLATVSRDGTNLCLNTSINSYIINADSLNVLTIDSPTSYIVMCNNNVYVLDNYDGTVTFFDADTNKELSTITGEPVYGLDGAYMLDEKKNVLNCYSYEAGEVIKSVKVPENTDYGTSIGENYLITVTLDNTDDQLMKYIDAEGKDIISKNCSKVAGFGTGIVYRESGSDEYVVYDALNNKEFTHYTFGDIDWLKRTADNNYLFISTIDNGGYVVDMNTGEIAITFADSSTIYDVVSTGKDYISVLYLADNGSTMLHIYETDNTSSPIAKIAGGLLINKNDEVLVFDGEKNIYAAPLQSKESIYQQSVDFVNGKTLTDREKQLYHCK